jgi:hypothetical protein
MRASGEDEAGVVPSIAFGVLSSFTGQLVAYPLETVTRHMQVQCPPYWSSQATATLQAEPCSCCGHDSCSLLRGLGRLWQVGSVRGRGGAGFAAVLADITSRGGPAALYKCARCASLALVPCMLSPLMYNRVIWALQGPFATW